MHESGEGAIQVLVENHRIFLRFLERRVGSREIAEDLLQDVFGRALARIDTLRDEESVVAWFYQALRNAVVDHHRRTDASARALAAFAAELEPAVPAPAIADEICACVSRLAATLKPEYADALQHIEIGGDSLAAYARARGISTNNAGVRVHRARAALRKQLIASCGTCAEHGCVDCSCREQPAPPQAPRP